VNSVDPSLSMLMEQMRSPKSGEAPQSPSPRPYRMQRRAELVDETKLRITEAAVRLHTTVGPSRASIAAIAEEAGVTRLTVYRHFGDAEALFTACMAHHAALYPWPDPATWAGITSLEERARSIIGALYAWYADHGADIVPIQRDMAFIPPATQMRMRKRYAGFVDAVVGGAGSTTDDGASDSESQRLRAVAGHVVALSTWRSLVVEQGLPPSVAVELAVSWVVAADRA
jgi:AcrR family transcriptional regulator